MRQLMVVAVVTALLGCSSGCSGAHRTGGQECIVARHNLRVLENPYPLNYPSTNPLPNKAIAELPSGAQVRIVERGYGKAFMYFAVELSEGQRGYVIYEGGYFDVVPGCSVTSK